MNLFMHAEPAGKGTVATVTVRAGGEDGEVLFIEKLDLAKSQARRKFADDFLDTLGDAAEEPSPECIEEELLRLAAGITAPPKPSALADAVELGDGRVVRPERFILPQVSGLAIPRRVLRGGQPAGEWLLLLRWQDGSRETIAMPEVLEVEGERVFIAPRPDAPPPAMLSAWSQSGRGKWLTGEAPMPADKLCRLLLESFAKYLDLPPESAAGTVAMLSAWTMLSYVYTVFDAVPYIAVSGPAGSGKSRVFELLNQLLLRPLSTSNISNPAVFRSLHSFGGVALLDEAERLRESRSPEVQELLSSLLAGYKRGGTVMRCEKTGDGFTMTHYGVFGPKALACINGLPPALASRCISIPMFRSPPGSPKPKLRVEADRERWQALRDGLHGIAMEHGEEWLGLPSRQDVVPEMSGRNFELWQPLLAIAAWFEEQGAGKMLAIMQEHALRSIEQNREASTPPDDEMLLQALARFVHNGSHPTAGDILAAVQEEDSSTFRNWSARGVSTHLGRYGISNRKSHGRLIFSPDENDLLRVQTNYGIPLGFNPAPPASTLPTPSPDNVPQRAPHTPGSHRGGAHGVHGAHPSEVKR
jgi:hypothetical protein